MPLRVYTKSLDPEGKLLAYSLIDLSRRRTQINLGNKANSLVKLFQLGYNIPPSLFLDYSFFNFFLNHHIIVYELVEMIFNSELADKLAVRSSSSVEDSTYRSFAGFFKTFLNVPKDREKVTQAIIECYQSFPNMAEISGTRMQMGIIIQPMINAKFSGILFTDSPQNPPMHKTPSRIYRVEYCVGTGERLTGSLITGHSITLDKSSGKIVNQEGHILLAQSDILTLWEAAKNLEKRFRFPQDVEFVISNQTNEVVLLQSRPLTAFGYSPEYVIKKENEKIREKFTVFLKEYNEYPIFSSTNISELFPNVNPLSFSIFKTIFAGTNREMGAINIGRRFLGYAPITRKEQTELFVAIGNQARVNLLIDALTFRLRGVKKDLYLKHAVKAFMDAIRLNTEKANYPEGELYLQAPNRAECKKYFGKFGATYFKCYTAFLRTLRNQKIPHILKTIDPKIKENDDYYRSELTLLSQTLRRMKLSDLKRKLNEYMEYLRKDLCAQYVIIARIAFLSTYLIKRYLNDPSSCLVRIFDGYETNTEKQNSIFIEKIFNSLLTQEECPDPFKIPNQQDLIEKVNHNEITLNQFLDILGHIGSLDIMQPRLNEMSEQVLKNLFQTQIDKSPQIDNNRVTEVAEFYKQYQKLKPRKTHEFKQWVEYAKIFMTLRETFKFEFLKIIHLIKMLVSQLQSRMSLDELIYYLKHEELQALKKKNLPRYRLRAMRRKAYSEACSLMKVKGVINESDDWSIGKSGPLTDPSDTSYKQVGGNTIQYGEAEGFCLVASSTQEYYRKLIEYRDRGIKDIIGFFKGLELSYCNLNELNGIVTENGGYLAHAATIAREYNIPYISGVSIDYFRDGYYIILDTNNHKVIYRESM